MLIPAAGRLAKTALATLLVLAVMLSALFWRLSRGPIDASVLRPGVERLLAAQVRGGRAHAGAIDLVWFNRSGALGLELRDVSLVDGQSRPVLRARRLQAGVSLASLALLTPAAGRIGAEDFFSAISVSKQGRYGLGYDAAGAPNRTAGLLGSFDDLVGKARAGRPLSFLNDVDLVRGVVALREVGGPVAWGGSITSAGFHKLGGKLDANVNLAVGQAWLKASGEGTLGLRRARISGSLAQINPARLLPWVGATRPLSILNAPVQGSGSLSWTSDRGVQTADVRVSAGAGSLRLDGGSEAFHAGEVRADYDPASGRVLIRTLGGSSARGELNLQGAAWLAPATRRGGAARLEVALAAAHSRLALAYGKTPLPMDNFIARGRFIPGVNRVEIDRIGAWVAGSPIYASGVLYRPRGRRDWGVALRGGISGMLTARQVIGFWPDGLSDDARGWLDGHILAGRLGHALFSVRLAPGEGAPHRVVANDRIRLTYDFEDADVLIDPSMPKVEHARGSGLLQGDRFDLTVRTAAMQKIALSQGLVTLTHLIGQNKRLEIRGHALGDARGMLQIVDGATDHAPSTHGFTPARLSGQGDIAFSVGRPLDEATVDDYDVAYAGVIRNAVVTDAAPALTLRSPSVGINGSLDRVRAVGDVGLGPFKGRLDFDSRFPHGRPMAQTARLDGLIDGSGVGLSGPSGSTLPFAARFDSVGDTGRGVIRSKAFDGQLSWSSDTGARFVLQGIANTAAWRSIGIPVAKGAPTRMPARLVLTRSGAVWTGAIEADAYSGTVVLADGPARHVHYSAELSSTEARKLGLAALVPAGKSTSLVVDASTSGDAGQASYSIGSWSGRVDWSQDKDDKARYRWRTSLTPADLRALGLPASIHPTAAVPVDVSLSATTGGWSGAAQVAGGEFHFVSRSVPGGQTGVSLTGVMDGSDLAGLGLNPSGMINGQTNVSATLVMAGEGVKSGRLDLDLQPATLNAPYVQWRKPAGRQLTVGLDFSRRADGGWDVSAIHGQGPGFSVAGSGGWNGSGVGGLKIANLALDGAFDGSLELTDTDGGQRLQAKARYFDARRLMQMGGEPSRPSSGPASPGRDFQVDVQLAQVRLSQDGIVRNVRLSAEMGSPDSQRLDVALLRDDGSRLLALRVSPDPAGSVVAGEASDVGDAAQALFGLRSFKGGRANLSGHLTAGGADLHVTMTNIRLIKAPAMARILTIGSLRGMADTLNGAGIEFTKVEVPVSVRGPKLTIGRARATGPAMGLTTQGVIDVDTHTVDLTGGVAPSYVLNSAAGVVPVVGQLLVSHKGEGMFGLTYSVKGAFSSPRISVNPFSLATPGILRRLFEGRSTVAATGG